jgi:hypothetical protein
MSAELILFPTSRRKAFRLPVGTTLGQIDLTNLHLWPDKRTVLQKFRDDLGRCSTKAEMEAWAKRWRAAPLRSADQEEYQAIIREASGKMYTILLAGDA